jgi:hypothetical protein
MNMPVQRLFNLQFYWQYCGYKWNTNDDWTAKYIHFDRLHNIVMLTWSQVHVPIDMYLYML